MTERAKTPVDAEQLVDRVRERYGKIAEGAGSCCGPLPSCCGPTENQVAKGLGYGSEQLAVLPDGANLGLGCGAPVRFLELEPRETVLDLGSGAGVDVFLAAKEVGPEGFVIGVDMTPEMLAKARANAEAGGFANVDFREGRLEALPVEDGTVDAVTSNCVINLVPEKAAVFREVARVLKPGGRMVVSDVVLERPLPDILAADLLAYVGCVAGAMQRDDYFTALRDAGLGEIEILHDVDFLAGLEESVPGEVRQILDQAGVKAEELEGVVRSVTYRARR